MADLDKIYLFRMTHIENVPHILTFGITHRNSNNANPNFRSIGDSSLISTRDNYQLNTGRLLGDYIPFYFGIRMPMLYVIQYGYNSLEPTPAQEIVYVVTSVQKIIDLGHEFVFTDGHAVDTFSNQNSNADIDNIDNFLDWNAIKSTNWKSDTDLDLKRRKQAEFLVLGDIAAEAILGYIVSDQIVKDRLLQMKIADDDIIIKNNFYFAP